MSNNLAMTVANKSLPLFATLTKPKADGSQNTFWCFRKPTSNAQGVKIPALSDSLPSAVNVTDDSGNVLGTVELVAGTTKDSGNPKVSGRTDITVDGVTKAASVLISRTADGAWYVKVSVNGKGGGGAMAVTDLSVFGL